MAETDTDIDFLESVAEVFKEATEKLKEVELKMRPRVKGPIAMRQIACNQDGLFGVDGEGTVYVYNAEIGGWKKLKMRELKPES
jgi:hypothetical protein